MITCLICCACRLPTGWLTGGVALNALGNMRCWKHFPGPKRGSRGAQNRKARLLVGAADAGRTRACPFSGGRRLDVRALPARAREADDERLYAGLRHRRRYQRCAQADDIATRNGSARPRRRTAASGRRPEADCRRKRRGHCLDQGAAEDRAARTRPSLNPGHYVRSQNHPERRNDRVKFTARRSVAGTMATIEGRATILIARGRSDAITSLQ